MNPGEDPCKGLYLFHFNVSPQGVSSRPSCHPVLQREEARPESVGLRAKERRELCLLWFLHSVPEPGLTADNTKVTTALEELPVQWERLSVTLNNMIPQHPVCAKQSPSEPPLQTLDCRQVSGSDA